MSGLSYALDGDNVFLFLLAFRLLNAVLVRTFFQPDEYYQALEPALIFAPGPSGAWITWEWMQHLRSAIHPALFGVTYHVADSLAFWTQSSSVRDGLQLYAPKIMQALLSALGDYHTWKLSSKVYRDVKLSNLTLCLTVLSPWQWFCSTRTFSNGLESTLTVTALYYWPFTWTTQNKRIDRGAAGPRDPAKERSSTLTSDNGHLALLLAATATILRPTNLLIWIVLALFVLFEREQSLDKDSQEVKQHGENSFLSRLLSLSQVGILCGGLVFVVSGIIDRGFYGAWTIPALNFLYFNVLQSLAVFYGNNNWHYYLTEGYPLLLTTVLPFALLGLYNIFRNSTGHTHDRSITVSPLKQLATICVALPAALSVLSHKEVRFIYPILGPLHIIAAAPAWHFFEPVLQPSPTPRSHSVYSSYPIRSLALLLIIFLSILIATYTSLIHNSGLIALPEYIRTEFLTHYHPNTSPSLPQNLTLAVLMPCHSIPWRSHLLHTPTKATPGIQAWALTCEPPLHLTTPTDKKSYFDEADIFYANPTLWLRKNMSRRPPRDFLTPNLKGTDPNRSPGIYTDERPPNARNKFLWHTLPDHDGAEILSDRSGLDITDLLPYLRTAPGQPPATERGVHIRRPWPHYLAFFEQLESVMVQMLRGSGYVECWRSFNSHWHDDWRRKGDVIVWCLFPGRAMVDVSVQRGNNINVESERTGTDQGLDQQRVMPDKTGVQTVVRFD